MSPRSQEFMAAARDALAAARILRDSDVPSRAVTDAYYAMLYAVRAALSEQDRYAKTHAGVWHLFRETFVLPGDFDERLTADAQRTQARREALDYEAATVPRHAAETTVAQAERFVDAVDALLET